MIGLGCKSTKNKQFLPWKTAMFSFALLGRGPMVNPENNLENVEAQEFLGRVLWRIGCWFLENPPV
jgi:hypothetical protein